MTDINELAKRIKFEIFNESTIECSTGTYGFSLSPHVNRGKLRWNWIAFRNMRTEKEGNSKDILTATKKALRMLERYDVDLSTLPQKLSERPSWKKHWKSDDSPL